LELQILGWNQGFQQSWNELTGGEGRVDGAAVALEPARVASECRGIYVVWSEHGELSAEVSGRFHYIEAKAGGFPVVGDWVAVSPRPNEGTATIHAILPRANGFARADVWSPDRIQTIAANIDIVFIITGLDRDFNVRRLERYLALSWNAGVTPVILLNKADLVHDASPWAAEVQEIAFGVPVHPISALEGTGFEHLGAYLTPGTTIAFLGSSGAGKSTIINRLAGEELQEIGEVRADDQRGRHTTSRRNLILLSSGAMLIDNPGMREVGLTDAEESVEHVFRDIEELAAGCRFRDCAHGKEPGCAVRAALEEGSLEKARYQSWLKLRREAGYWDTRGTVQAILAKKERWKRISRSQKQRREPSR
jgi:ribosome biogenesis GTPase